MFMLNAWVNKYNSEKEFIIPNIICVLIYIVMSCRDITLNYGMKNRDKIIPIITELIDVQNNVFQFSLIATCRRIIMLG